MKKLKIVFVIAISINCYSQNTENESKKLNAIVNYFIERDSTLLDKKALIVNGFNPDIDAPAEWYIHESIFSKLNSSFQLSDSLYYYQYFNQVKDIKFELLKNKDKYKFIDKKIITDFVNQSETDYKNGIKYDFYEEFEKKIGIIQAFGLPIISKDGKYLLLSYIKYGPRRKAKKFTKLYFKENNDWIYQKTLIEIEK